MRKKTPEERHQGFLTFSSSLWAMANLCKGKLNICSMLEYDNKTINQTNWKQTLLHNNRPGQPPTTVAIVYPFRVCMTNSCSYGLYIKARFTSAKTASVAEQQREALESAPLSRAFKSTQRQTIRQTLDKRDKTKTESYSPADQSGTPAYTTLDVFFLW